MQECCCKDYSKRPIVLSVSSCTAERLLFGCRNAQLVCKKCGRPITDYEVKERLKHAKPWFCL